MMVRVPMPVTAGLALALAQEGDVFLCAEKLAVLDDPDLRPAAVLMTDVLRPLLAMGAITPDRRIDRTALLRLGVGVLGLCEENLWRRMTLEALAAACDHWRRSVAVPQSDGAPAVQFMQEMSARFPDVKKGDGS